MKSDLNICVLEKGSAVGAHSLSGAVLEPAALEKLLAARDVARPADVASVAAAWQRAAHATPHGQPILLENDPLRAR